MLLELVDPFYLFFAVKMFKLTYMRVLIKSSQVDYLDTVVVSFDEGMQFPAMEYVQAKITKEMKSGKLLKNELIWWLIMLATRLKPKTFWKMLLVCLITK